MRFKPLSLILLMVLFAPNNPESIVAVGGGASFYVGDAGQNQIHQYNSSGGLVNTFTAATENRGTDWIDFQNANTILYTSEGSTVKSFNTATNTQNPDFATGLPGSFAYALRVIPARPFFLSCKPPRGGRKLAYTRPAPLAAGPPPPGEGLAIFSLSS